MLLKSLSEAVGISGKEDAVRGVILPAIRDHAQDIRIDPLGSIIARKPGTGERSLRVMLAAHMDEVGLMVMGFDGDGLIRFTNVGGIDERILPGLRVKIGDVNGVIIWTPIHVNTDQNTVKMSSLRIDIGATSKEEVSNKVKRGDRIAFVSRYLELDGGRMLRGKAFDDRGGCSLLVDVLQSETAYPVEVLAAFTVQEEIGLRGAQVAAQALNPDVAFILEGTTANDLPNPTAAPDDETDENPTCVMGGGPVLTIMDTSMIVQPHLLAFMREVAAQEGIPYQLKTRSAGGTDGGAIHTANAGAPAAVIALPCRYVHTPSAYLLRRDYDDALRLIKALLAHITAETLLH